MSALNLLVDEMNKDSEASFVIGYNKIDGWWVAVDSPSLTLVTEDGRDFEAVVTRMVARIS
jgi:hypothetical protein